MNFTQKQKVIAGVAGILILGFVLVLLGVLPGLKSSNPDPRLQKATLSMWTLGDSANDYQTAIDDFKTTYPNTEIQIRSFNDQANYEKTILNALAINQGPDIFMIPNGALLRDLSKLAPAPAGLLTANQFNALFPQIVGEDFVYQNQIYALPLAIDTLAMFYNRDFFNAAGLPLPPTTWEEFSSFVPRLTKFDANHELTQAGAAIGGSEKNIAYGSDLLNLLMLQKQSPMTQQSNDTLRASFSNPASLEAFNFYIGFANPRESQYTWNETQKNNRQSFLNEKTAIIFDYAEDVNLFRLNNQNLNFAVAAMPQFSGQNKPVAMARYWGYSVSRQSQQTDLAWQFIANTTTKASNANTYINSVQKPPALNESIIRLNSDPEWSVFAKQALIAKSWLRFDPLAVSGIFSKAVANVLSGQANVNQALQQAENDYNSLMLN